MSAPELSFLLLAFILGLRHGVDWDHIAAITDLVGSENSRKKGFTVATFYAVGHELVILILGMLAIVLGYALPDWVDGFMEKLVGVTLIVLSVLLLNYLLRNNKEAILISRWRLAYNGISNFVSWLGWKLGNRKADYNTGLNTNMSNRGAVLIGVIHGIGAETPSQLLLFTAATGSGSISSGILTVLAFAVGLFVTHLTMVIASLLGVSRITSKPGVFRAFGIAASLFSIGLGILYLTGGGGWLPGIL